MILVDKFLVDFGPHFFFCESCIVMRTVGEIVGAGLVAYMFLALTNQSVKNSGILDMGGDSGPEGTGNEALYASAEEQVPQC